MTEAPQYLVRPLAQRVRDLADPVPIPAVGSTPESVIDAAFAALDAGKTHYTDRPGILPLREAVCQRLESQYGLTLKPDAVTITCGATEARYVALKQLAQPGSQIATTAGDAPRIAGTAALLGVEIVTAVQSDSPVSCLYLSAASDPAEAAVLLDQIEGTDAWILYDTAVVPIQKPLPHPGSRESLASRVVTLGDFASALAGWRVGFMAGSSKAGALRAFKQSMTICTPSVSQWAAAGLEPGE